MTRSKLTNEDREKHDQFYEQVIEEQKALNQKFGLPWVESLPGLKVGIAKNVREGLLPINGLRHQPKGDTTGWYIWAGEDTYSDAPDFFEPLHVEHLSDVAPMTVKYLGLPPGYRFLTDGKHEDVWDDKALLG